MTIWILILLAIIQGVTEFLPISSSGHLVLLYKIFNIEENTILLSVVLHAATLLSILIYYWNDLVKLIKKPFCKTNINLLITTITTCTIVLFIKPIIESSFDGRWLNIGFIITAIILFVSQILHKNAHLSSIDIRNLDINKKSAFAIGVSQAIACFPAISRSGTTIACALLCNVRKEDATKYSFLISIPIVFASLIMEIIECITLKTPINFEIIPVVMSFIIAFVVGLASIKLMTKLVNKGKLYYFSFYLIFLVIILTIFKI
ncbi:MAG: undecaprenyl-diphosphate phosphatase [Clostridia bacterium]|nr:undecaprenyl-diphosphate phosphatase [Clostridia bacterium]